MLTFDMMNQKSSEATLTLVVYKVNDWRESTIHTFGLARSFDYYGQRSLTQLLKTEIS